MTYWLRPATCGIPLRRFMLSVVILFLSLLALSRPLPAQTTSASVSGTIIDRSGGLVPGVQVIVINTDTNEKYETKTNGAGVYNVPNVKPGHYRIMVSKLGFKEIDLRDITLNVQDSVNRNFTLDVGGTSEVVIVNAENGVNINTTDASVSTVVDRQFAENLPLNGRSFQTLIQLTPGVVLTPSNFSDSGQFSVNGQRAASNYWMVDGVSANIGVSSIQAGNGFAGALGSFSAQGGTNSLVSVDAMQEFRIQTSTYAPEFGRTPGAQISIVTRSGASQFHGALYDYFRNDVLDANNWFNTAVTPPLPKAQERQNDFGGTLSGPIFKDKTFCFFSYEGLRLRLPQSALTTVPCDSSCQVFGNARTGAISAMQPFLNAYPLPNGPEVFTPCTPNVNGCPASGEQPTGSAQFNASFSNPSTLDAYSLRIDHRLKEKLALFGRYNYSPSEIVDRGITAAAPLSAFQTIRISTQTATVGVTWIVSPSISDDLRFNYSGANASSQASLDNFGGAVPLASLPFPGGFTSQNAEFVFGIFPLTQGFLIQGKLQKNLQRQINIVDNLSMQKGSHSLKLGADFRRLSPLFGPQLYSQQVGFLDMPSAESGSLVFSTVVSGRSGTLLFRNLGVFVQDTWRIIPRLTLTYGLRWDVDFAPSSINGPSLMAVTGFNLNDLSNLALAPSGTPPFKTPYGNIAPRIGAAYQVGHSQNWETVLRAGFGLFFDLATQEVGNSIFTGAFPFGASNSCPPLTPNPACPSGNLTFPLDSATAAPPPIQAPGGGLGTVFGFNPNLKLPYTLEWNVALEQALGREQTISGSYIGSVGRRLIQSAFIPSPNPNFAFAQLVTNAATSDYNALQVQFQRRLARGLQMLASYTWSHSIDTASAGSAAGNSANLLASTLSPNANRGPSDFDIRNAFSTGATYDIPAPKINGFTNAILHGWSLENVIQARSAPPVNVSDVLFGKIGGVSVDIRPDVVPGQPLYLYGSQYPGGRALNPAAFTDPPGDPSTRTAFRQGNLPRNALRGFGATQWDLAVHRDFPIRESLKLQFRAEIFNALNHPNFGQPLGQFGFGGFGVSNQMLAQYLTGGGNVGGGAFSALYQIGGPRSIQFALKFMF